MRTIRQRKMLSLWSSANWRRYNICRYYTMPFKRLKAKPQNLAALRFFGRVARSQVNCFAFRGYYTISFRHGSLRGMHTVREGRCFPFGQARTGAGIISVDIIPYRSDMVLSEGCARFANVFVLPLVGRKSAQV